MNSTVSRDLAVFLENSPTCFHAVDNMKKALLDAGIGKDILGSYDNGVYQPVFSVIAKNAELEQKEEFIRVIEDTLKNIAENGIDRKAVLAGINYHEFRFREADFGNYPRGLMYGLQLFDSWLYDEEKPFIHMQALPVFAFLKDNVGTGYFEELIRTYLLNNMHGSIVIIRPEKGRTARMDRELAGKLKAYKESRGYRIRRSGGRSGQKAVRRGSSAYGGDRLHGRRSLHAGQRGIFEICR